LTVYLAEDDSELRRLLALLLRKDGHSVIEFCNGGDLMVELATVYLYGIGNCEDAVVVADLRMPVLNGLSVMQQLGRSRKQPPFILMTAFPDVEVYAEASRLGAAAVLAKPFDSDELRRLVRRVNSTVRVTAPAH
jgi:FixJ family two-component response regulator